MIKQLVVIRHAQAESHHKDFERELSAFGIKQIESIAKKISIQAIKIDKVLYSAAKRTKQSAEILVSQLGQKIAMEADDQLYLCSASYLYDAIAITDSSIATLCLLGHNPGISEFVNSLIQTPIFIFLKSGILSGILSGLICTDCFLFARNGRLFPRNR